MEPYHLTRTTTIQSGKATVMGLVLMTIATLLNHKMSILKEHMQLREPMVLTQATISIKIILGRRKSYQRRKIYLIQILMSLKVGVSARMSLIMMMARNHRCIKVSMMTTSIDK